MVGLQKMIKEARRKQLLPPIGARLRINNVMYRVSYHNLGRMRFTAEIEGVVKESQIAGPDVKVLSRVEQPAEG